MSPRPAAGRPVRIHLPWTSVIVPVLLFLCVTPLATAGGGWIVMYALPALALVAVIFGGTTATRASLSTRWLRGRTRVRWDDLHQIEFPGQRWGVAVTQSGRRVVLPGVRPTDLPRIVAAAGGRLFLARKVAAGGTDGARPPADSPTRQDRTEPPAEPPAGALPDGAEPPAGSAARPAAAAAATAPGAAD